MVLPWPLIGCGKTSKACICLYGKWIQSVSLLSVLPLNELILSRFGSASQTGGIEETGYDCDLGQKLNYGTPLAMCLGFM